MNKTTTERRSVPVGQELDPEVLAFRQQFDDQSPLDEHLREGARRMLQSRGTKTSAYVDGEVFVPRGVQWVTDRYSLAYHGVAHSHMDALCHLVHNGNLYNGFPQSVITDAGSGRLSIQQFK